MTSSGRSAGRVFDNKKDEASWFDADEEAGSSSPSSSGWDPRKSLGASEPQRQDEGSSFDRDSPRRSGGPAGGSEWDRAGATSNRGGRGGSSSRGQRSSSRGGGSRGRGYSSQSDRSSRGSADSRDGGSFSGYSRGRDIVTGEPIKSSKDRTFSQDSFGGDWGDLE